MIIDEEKWVRIALINLLVLIYSPWEWCLGFAVFKGTMHKHPYWSTWERMALMVTVFVLGQHLLPITLNVAVFVWYMLSDWIASLTVSRLICVICDYTLLPIISTVWTVLPVFVHMVFVPCILPEIIKQLVEEAMCLRLRMSLNEARRMRHEMANLEEQLAQHKENADITAKRREELLDARDKTISALQIELRRCETSNASQAAEIKRLAHENKHHQEILEKKLTDLRHELTAKSDACKADLNARIHLLNEELAQRREDKSMYERKAQNIKALHERRAEEMDSKLNRFAHVLQTVEAVYHKLTIKLRPTDVSAAIAVLEDSIQQRESETRRMVDKVQSLEDQMTKAERKHTLAMEKMQEELKQKDSQIQKLSEQNKKAKSTDPNTHLNRCDKQLLLKVAKSPEFAWHFRNFLQSLEFEPFIKGYMKLDAQHQHLFRWMMSIINEDRIDEFIHCTFGNDRALLSTMTTGIIEPALLSTPRRVELTKKNTNAVLLAIHPDKLSDAPAWLRTLRERMFKAFQEARRVLG